VLCTDDSVTELSESTSQAIQTQDSQTQDSRTQDNRIGHPAVGTTGELIVISRQWVVEEPLATEIYEMMLRAYEPHRTDAPFRYVWTRDEWLEMMRHPRIMKFIATVDGRLSGVGTGVMGDAMREIGTSSVDHTEDRHPGRFVICQEDTFVDPSVHDTRVFLSLLRDGLRFGRENDAVVVFSTTDSMVERGFVRLLQRIIRKELGTEIQEVGAQRYYEFDTRPPDGDDDADSGDGDGDT